MAGEWKVVVKGELEFKRKLAQMSTDLYGPEYRDAFRSAALMVERDAKLEVPVDTGRLKTSIVSDVVTETSLTGGGSTYGVVGSNVEYAPDQEFGTGTFVGKAATAPRAAEVATWARRHGFPNGGIVASAIYRAGGIRPRRFLQKAFEKNQSAIRRKIEEVVSRIASK